MHRKIDWLRCGVLGLAVMLTACGGAQREATEPAINAAQTAINAASAEAAKYVPDQLKSSQDALQSAKDALAKGDYSAAWSAAKDASSKATDLVAAAAAKKEELMKNWTSLSESMHKSLEQVKAKLEAYPWNEDARGVGQILVGSGERPIRAIEAELGRCLGGRSTGEPGSCHAEGFQYKSCARKIDGDARH